MPVTSDVVIIGGGIIGLSVVYHLAREGVRRVAVVEQRQLLGSETTSKSGGGLRKQFSLPVNIRMAIYSQKFYRELDAESDHSLDLRSYGYLLLAASEGHRDALLRNIRTQRELGVTDVQFIDVATIRTIAPDLHTEDLIGGAYCPSDGYLSPDGAAQEIARRANRLGVRFFTGERVLRIGVEKGQVAHVVTTGRTICTRTVIDTAGPHAGELARTVGVTLPIQPLRRNLFLVGPIQRMEGPYPVVLDLQHGFSARHEPEGVLIGGGDRNEPAEFHFSANPDLNYFANISPHLISRIPSLEHAALLRASAGTDGYTPDGSAIVDRLDSPAGFYCAAGFCGHGVMQAPAVGKVVAELVVTGRASIDIEGLSLKRFHSGGQLLTEGMVMAHQR